MRMIMRMMMMIMTIRIMKRLTVIMMAAPGHPNNCTGHYDDHDDDHEDDDD